MKSTDLVEGQYPTHMARAFRDLRSGRHICIEDGHIFQDIRRHEEQYFAVLSALGYRLVHHPQGFYYLSGGNQLNSKGVKAITLFLLVLFQHLEDHKFESEFRSWERNLTDHTFKIAELPHFASSGSRMLMRNLDISEENLREKVLRLMARLGILEILPGESFAFRAPVYRFVDLCIEYASRKVDQVEEGGLENDSQTDESEEIWEDVDADDGDEELE